MWLWIIMTEQNINKAWLYHFLISLKISCISSSFFFLAALGLYGFAWAFSGWGEWRLLSVAVLTSLTVLQSSSPRCAGFRSARGRSPLGALGHAGCQWARHSGSAALLHVASSRTGDRIRVPCTGWQTPVHCATVDKGKSPLDLLNWKFRPNWRNFVKKSYNLKVRRPSEL